MKYFYVPVKADFDSVSFCHTWFDSPKRMLSFRNQYGTVFLFASKNMIRAWLVLFLLAGIVIGKLL